jgi:transposase-like protein
MKKGIIKIRQNNKEKSTDNTQFSRTDIIRHNSLIQTHINGRICPHCQSHNVVSKGNYKGRKRYLCKECHKSYNDLTKTPFSGIHNHEKVIKYLECMLLGQSIRQSAKAVNISKSTSFEWRHKLLNKINKLPAPHMKNVMEVIEIKLPYSAKGQKAPIPVNLMNSKVSTVFICDRANNIDSNSIVAVRSSQNKIFKRIIQNNDIELLHHRHKLLNKIDTFHRNITTKNSTNNYSTITNVIEIVNKWMTWMERFNGVATKYLNNYLHWFDFLQNSRLKQNQANSFINLLLHHDKDELI